ncbi:MAG: trehalose-phosphatase [Acidimicrobiales bacterium]
MRRGRDGARLTSRVPSAHPAAGVRAALSSLIDHPTSSAVVTDFDGTMAPIIEDPAAARPLAGIVPVLSRLADLFEKVAVVSGRPVQFLVDALGSDVGGSPWPSIPSDGGPDLGAGLGPIRLVGLYGLEWYADGQVIREPGVELWRSVIARAADRLATDAPAGIVVEPKGLTVAVHWRRAPDQRQWVTSTVAAQAGEHGLSVHAGRCSLELRPPMDVDKGAVIRQLVDGCTDACYLGDDLGDLPAFGALRQLRAEQAVQTTAIAVVDDESDPVVAAAADVVVDGPAGVLELLVWMANEAAGVDDRPGDPRAHRR